MDNNQKLSQLRETYGENAEAAYKFVGDQLQNKPNMDLPLDLLHEMFEKYGVAITGAVLQLHAEEKHAMSQFVRRGAAKAATLAERLAAVRTSE